jgi:hypothetical protein
MSFFLMSSLEFVMKPAGPIATKGGVREPVMVDALSLDCFMTRREQVC